MPVSEAGVPDPLIARVDRMTQAIAVIGFCGLVIMALLTFYDGAARFLGMPRLSGFSDYGELVFPIVISSCFPAGLLQRRNLTIRLMGSAIDRAVARWVEFVAALIVLAFFALLAWQFVLMTGLYLEAGRTTPTIELRTAPWWAITTAIMILCVPTQLLVTTALLRAAINGRDASLPEFSGSAADRSRPGQVHG